MSYIGLLNCPMLTDIILAHILDLSSPLVGFTSLVSSFDLSPTLVSNDINKFFMLFVRYD